LFRFLTSGESHGKMLAAIIDGVPAGLSLTAEDINKDLSRRQKGYGRGGRMAIEQDKASIISGVRFGKTLGSPVTLAIHNRDWQNWSDCMAAQSGNYDNVQQVTVPRPGHADLAGAIKYGHEDIRNVIERASARETAARVAVGAVAKRILQELGISIIGYVISIGQVTAKRPGNLSFAMLQNRSEKSLLRCIDPSVEDAMIAAIEEARNAGDTLGGVFEITAFNVPTGLGSYSEWDRRIDAELARAVMGIPAVKGVEIGLGFESAGLPGSQVHDEIGYSEGSYTRPTNNAGGIEGGVTNGQPIIIRAAMKPIPTLSRRLESVDIKTKEPKPAHAERSDVCAVPAAAVVGEAMVAITLAAATLEKFGGDSMDELRRSFLAYHHRR